ncbi:MAG: hypothetical protein B7Z78_00360 [Rhodospirillales bacterium 20-60-12]|nr:MAG: hypothetical protein B7Z78_00360 [Rhodospirillales bacterium 20-60-12]
MSPDNIATILPALHKPAAPAPERLAFLGFVSDRNSEDCLRAALTPAFPKGVELRTASYREALAALRHIPTPQVLLIDLTGEDQPLSAVLDLAEIVEPGTIVLAIGDSRDVSFYRSVTRGIGVREYLPKPISQEQVARLFLPWAQDREPSLPEPMRGGRMISVTGTRGGIGSSIIAANLAWLIGVETRRHTILLDADLHMGTAALILGGAPSSGLRTALEAPDRIDSLLIERSAQPIAERLHVLAAEEPLADKPLYAAGAGGMLADALRLRYNFVVADVPAKPMPFARELLGHAHQRVFVVDPTPVSARNLRNLLSLPTGPLQSRRPLLVLNQADRPYALPRAKLEDIAGITFDITLPYLPALIQRAAHFGVAAAAQRSKFRDAMLQLAQAVGASPRSDSPILKVALS